MKIIELNKQESKKSFDDSKKPLNAALNLK